MIDIQLWPLSDLLFFLVDDERTFGVDMHHFLALLIGHENLMEIDRRVAALGQAFPPGNVLIGGHAVRRHVGGVVDAADDQGPVRVAILEDHHHLVAHPWPETGAPAVARPDLGHPHPA